MKRKGIILAGGTGRRLYPSTKVVSKHLLPVFDKPMIYYPLATLMIAGIREIFIISTPRDTPNFSELLGDGSQWGLKIEYGVQPTPDGVAQALIIAEDFLNGEPSALILGDNIFYGNSLSKNLVTANERVDGATIFATHVQDPEKYGVAEFDNTYNVISLEEKPKQPKSNYAITGLYFYDSLAPQYAKQLKPSPRGELEITDLNKIYFEEGQLFLELMGRGYAWLDTGTPESLVAAQQFVQIIEGRQGLKISCPEEIAFRLGWITQTQLETLAKTLLENSYGKYLMRVITDLEQEGN